MCPQFYPQGRGQEERGGGGRQGRQAKVQLAVQPGGGQAEQARLQEEVLAGLRDRERCVDMSKELK